MRLPSRLPGVVAALALTVVLAGCGGGGGEEPGGDPTGSASTAPYLPVPDGVELTPQGSELAVGDTATVAFELAQDKVAAVEITVTSLEKAKFDMFVGWELTKAIKKTAPYFVRAKVTNVGDPMISKDNGPPVPLYAVDGENRLIESSLFTGTFKPCDGASFPKKFPTGATLSACMVYLAPGKGDLTAASFRPSQEFDPIIWTGDLVPAKTGDQSGQGGNQGGKQDDKGGTKDDKGDDAGNG